MSELPVCLLAGWLARRLIESCGMLSVARRVIMGSTLTQLSSRVEAASKTEFNDTI
jgi:hypothetical protein